MSDLARFTPGLSFPHAPLGALRFSDEIEAQRRRKGSGPEGRAEAPVRRDDSGGTGGGSGGGWVPSGGGGGRSGGVRLPPWMMIILLILFLLFGGKGALNSILGGSTDTGSTTDVQPQSQDYPTTIPDVQSAPAAGFTPPAGSSQGSWTVMLYQDADDQILEQDIFTDFNEAERVGSTDKVHIVAQLDRFAGAFNGDGNWTGTRRYYVTQDDDLNAIHSQLAADLGEVNMSDPATLVDFVTWAAKTFPADHYVLILSDHGMGWPGGWTDPSPETSPNERAPLARLVGNALYLDQLDGALGQIRQQAGIDKFDIIGMDACLMSQLEVLSMLQPYANYAITSEETEPSLGWAYTAFLQALTQNPGMNAADLSKLVVQSYIDGDQRIVDNQARQDFLRQMGGTRASAEQVAFLLEKDVTLSAIDLSKVPQLMTSVNNLAYGMQSADQSEIASARDYALSFTNIFGQQTPPAYIDLGNFVQILARQSSDSNVQQLSAQVYNDLGQAVIAEKHGSSKKGATGVAIYYPNSTLYRSPYSGPQSYTTIASHFAQESLWDDFLAYHYNDRSFQPSTREAVVPASDAPTRSPGLGSISVSPLRLSAKTAAPGQPVTMRADVNGTNIGNILLFVGYYDSTSNSIFVADTDFLESPDTQQVDGVSYPRWGNGSQFTVKFDWDPTVFTISDGTTTAVALFNPLSYGASAAEAVYTVDGKYTFVDGGQQLSARMNFRDGKFVSVFGITGQGDTGAPREITPKNGDTFTIQEKWLDLDSQGAVTKTSYQDGKTLTFGDQPFTWQETYAAAGNYIIGFVVTDLDGNTQETFDQVTVK